MDKTNWYAHRRIERLMEQRRARLAQIFEYGIYCLCAALLFLLIVGTGGRYLFPGIIE